MFMSSGDFSKKIIAWYQDHHRELPWRKKSNPYHIWLSEIILQQTRVAQGLPYYHAFVKNFPNIAALAKAPQQKILRAWQGLGYYSRARNLHACAKVVAGKHGGKFPNTYEELLELPGIGSYTAAAIASIAYNQPIAVVDGNVYRVLSRVFGMEYDISTGNGKKKFNTKAQAILNIKNPGIHNQAVMEFGALCCTPKNPHCSDCIFSNACFAKKHEMVDRLPFKSKKVKVRNRYFTYFVFKKGNTLAMQKRTKKDIWSGLYDFYLVEGTRKTSGLKEMNGFWPSIKGAKIIEECKPIKHVLTHQHIFARFVVVALDKGFSNKNFPQNSKLKFYTPRKIAILPKPALITRFLKGMAILE